MGSGVLEGWNVYGADLLPGDAALDIDGSGNGFSNGDDTATNSLMDDPVITGNKWLSFNTNLNDSDQWYYDGDIGSVTTITVCLRAKSLDTALYDIIWDVDIRTSSGRSRFIGYDYEISAEQGGEGTGGAPTYTFTDDNAWHIYRITIEFDTGPLGEDVCKIWQDGILIIDTYSDGGGGSGTFKFGSGSSTTDAGCIYDWIIFRTDDTYTPAELAIPASLPQ